LTGIRLVSEISIQGLQVRQNITAYPIPIDAEATFTWTNSDPTVVYYNLVDNPESYGSTISMLSLKEGTSTLTATAGKYNKSCKVTVTNHPLEVERFTLDIKVVLNINDDPHIITAIPTPSNVSTNYTWNNSDPTVISINTSIQQGTTNGLCEITPLKEGFSKVTIKAENGVSSSCSVYVKNEESQQEIINIVAINDFHGAIEESGNQMGLAKIGTYLKNKGLEKNTLTLSQGDDWQGSIYSNHNRGRLVNDVYAYSRLSARTIGNHDFDWGIEPLVENTKTGYDGYVTPVLGANVYDFDFVTKTVGSNFQSDIAQKSIIYNLENSLTVGIVGVIGKNQITSITSNFTQTIHFIDHVQVIKDEATRLREEGCDVVIASVHAGEEDVLNQSLGQYVDLVLCGHTHQNSYALEDDVAFLQFGANGNTIGNVQLVYDTSVKKVISTTYTKITSSNINAYVSSIDPVIKDLISDYHDRCASEADQIVASNTSGYWSKTAELPNLMCEAIYDQAKSEGYTIDLAYCNEARAYISSYKTSWKYEDIYKSFPFDNDIYIVKVYGRELYYEIHNYNNAYFSESFSRTINPNQLYTIAVIDFLIFHTNSKRYYDFFPNFNPSTDVLGILSKNYRLILRDWLDTEGYKRGKDLSVDDYSSSLYCFNTANVTLN